VIIYRPAKNHATVSPIRPTRRAGLPVFLFLAAASICTPIAPDASAQGNPAFNISLSVDYEAAEQTLKLLQDEYVSPGQLAELRGNRIAASTTGLISGNGAAPALLRSCLDSLQAHQILRDDIFRLEEARANAGAIADLLRELQQRNFNRRVIATVEQVFPQDVKIDAVIPVYVVALGHENADAYVRSIVWKGATPEFVGEGEGELTIIINLAAGAAYPADPESQLMSILVTVAHEVFHAAFGLYKDSSPAWKAWRAEHTSALDYLLDLVQNEGIAYYLSMEQRSGDRLPSEWTRHIGESFATFNGNVERLLAGRLSRRETADILTSANLSGYWESYGSMVGMAMARGVDRMLGREALIETISRGPTDFLAKYHTLTKVNSGLPALSPMLIKKYALK
jgi:hypothetical protein